MTSANFALSAQHGTVEFGGLIDVEAASLTRAEIIRFEPSG